MCTRNLQLVGLVILSGSCHLEGEREGWKDFILLLRKHISPRYGSFRIVGKQAFFMAEANCRGLLHQSPHEGLAWGMGTD